MIKLITLTCLLLSSAASFSFPQAIAKDYIDYFTFLQLPKKDQRKLIKTSQLLAAEYEQNYINDLKRLKLKRKYSYVEDFFNGLILQSHATDGNGIVKSQSLCIYAGWPSVLVNAGNNIKKCRHPLWLKDEIDKDEYDENIKLLIKNSYKSYKENNKGSSGVPNCPPLEDTDQMVCNPSLFGKKPDGKPFCSVGNSDSVNSSWGCLKAFNEYVKDKPEQKNQILDKIVENSVSDSEDNPIPHLSALLQMNYDICMCKGSSGYINERYSQLMFKRRTCYAWLAQTRNILDRLKPGGSCVQLAQMPYEHRNGIMIASLSNWAEEASANISEQLSEVEADDYFEMSESNADTWETSRANLEPDKDNCPINFDGKLTLKVHIDPENNNFSIVTATIEGNINQNIPLDWQTIQGANPVSGNTNQYRYPRLDTNYDIQVTSEIGSEPALILARDIDLSCSLSLSENDPNTINIKADNRVLTAADATISITPQSYTWKNDSPGILTYSQTSDAQHTQTADKVELKITYKSNTIKCEVELPKPEYSIEITNTENSIDHDLTAIVKKDEKLFEADLIQGEGLSIVWVIPDGEETETEAEAAATEVAATATDAVVVPSPVSRGPAQTIETTKKIAKKENEQTVVAKLMKADKEVAKDDTIINPLGKQELEYEIEIVENQDKGDHHILKAKVTNKEGEIPEAMLGDYELTVTWTKSHTEKENEDTKIEEAGVEADPESETKESEVAKGKLSDIKVQKNKYKQTVKVTLSKNGLEKSDSVEINPLEEDEKEDEKKKKDKKAPPAMNPQQTPMIQGARGPNSRIHGGSR